MADSWTSSTVPIPIRSDMELPAIHVEAVTGDVVGHRAGHEHHGVRDRVGYRQAAQIAGRGRLVVDHLCIDATLARLIVEERLHHVGVDPPWCDRVDANASRTELGSQ